MPQTLHLTFQVGHSHPSLALGFNTFTEVFFSDLGHRINKGKSNPIAIPKLKETWMCFLKPTFGIVFYITAYCCELCTRCS